MFMYMACVLRIFPESECTEGAVNVSLHPIRQVPLQRLLRVQL